MFLRRSGDQTKEKTKIMATRTVLVDDMDGGDAETTIAFVINGESYSLDLSESNAAKFHQALHPFITAAKERAAKHTSALDAELAGVEQRTAIREWARKKGLEISDRGRIPQDIIDAYNKKNRGSR